MRGKPGRQAPHFRDHYAVPSGNKRDDAAGRHAFFDNACKMPGRKKFGDVAMDREKTVSANALEQLRSER